MWDVLPLVEPSSICHAKLCPASTLRITELLLARATVVGATITILGQLVPAHHRRTCARCTVIAAALLLGTMTLDSFDGRAPGLFLIGLLLLASTAPSTSGRIAGSVAAVLSAGALVEQWAPLWLGLVRSHPIPCEATLGLEASLLLVGLASGVLALRGRRRVRARG